MSLFGRIIYCSGDPIPPRTVVPPIAPVECLSEDDAFHSGAAPFLPRVGLVRTTATILHCGEKAAFVGASEDLTELP